MATQGTHTVTASQLLSKVSTHIADLEEAHSEYNKYFIFTSDVIGKQHWGISAHMALMYMVGKRRMMEICLRVIKSKDLVNIDKALKTFHMMMFLEWTPHPHSHRQS